MKCRVCSDDYEAAGITAGGSCRWCAEKERFAGFARACGLDTYPDPSGGGYLYGVDGDGFWKKIERTAFMNDLWNALVRAKGGNDSLLLRKK